MTDLPVPPEAYEAAARALYDYEMGRALDDDPWEILSADDQQSYVKAATPTVDAALAIFWPLAVAEGRRQAAAAIEALRTLVALKDGPRDLAYVVAKVEAWENARRALAALDGTDE